MGTEICSSVLGQTRPTTLYLHSLSHQCYTQRFCKQHFANFQEDCKVHHFGQQAKYAWSVTFSERSTWRANGNIFQSFSAAVRKPLAIALPCFEQPLLPTILKLHFSLQLQLDCCDDHFETESMSIIFVNSHAQWFKDLRLGK